jgi:hypothetical protein
MFFVTHNISSLFLRFWFLISFRCRYGNLCFWSTRKLHFGKTAARRKLHFLKKLATRVVIGIRGNVIYKKVDQKGTEREVEERVQHWALEPDGSNTYAYLVPKMKRWQVKCTRRMHVNIWLHVTWWVTVCVLCMVRTEGEDNFEYRTWPPWLLSVAHYWRRQEAYVAKKKTLCNRNCKNGRGGKP